MSGVTTSSLSLAWSHRNWVILDYEEANGLTIRPWAPFLLSLFLFLVLSSFFFLDGRWEITLFLSCFILLSVSSLWKYLSSANGQPQMKKQKIPGLHAAVKKRKDHWVETAAGRYLHSARLFLVSNFHILLLETCGDSFLFLLFSFFSLLHMNERISFQKIEAADG